MVLALVLSRVYVWRRRQSARLQETIEAGRVRRAPAAAVAASRAAGNRLHAVEDRSTVFGFAALAACAVLFFAAGLGPFRWFRGGDGGSDDASNQLAAQPAVPTQASEASAGGRPAGGFSDSFTGTASQRQSGSTIFVTLHASATGDRPVTLDVQLQLQQSGRGTSATANTLNLVAADGSALCLGEVDSLTAQGLAATCDGQGTFAGHRLTLQLDFAQGFASQVSGTTSATITG